MEKRMLPVWYTARFGHLKFKPNLKVGDRVTKGDKIGTMGNSGASSAAHLHIDCAQGKQVPKNDLHRMPDMFGPGKVVLPALDQAEWFIDDDLFKTKVAITTYPHDPAYFKNWGWHHIGFDVVPEDRHTHPGVHSDIYWNRSYEGEVIFSGVDPLGLNKGYGNVLLIQFEAEYDIMDYRRRKNARSN